MLVLVSVHITPSLIFLKSAENAFLKCVRSISHADARPWPTMPDVGQSRAKSGKVGQGRAKSGTGREKSGKVGHHHGGGPDNSAIFVISQGYVRDLYVWIWVATLGGHKNINCKPKTPPTALKLS